MQHVARRLASTKVLRRAITQAGPCFPLASRYPIDPPPQTLTSKRAAWWWAPAATPDSCSFGQAETPHPPSRPEVRSRYGMEWTDELSWMERQSPALRSHLEEEGRHARAILSGLQPLADVIEDEMLVCASTLSALAPPPSSEHQLQADMSNDNRHKQRRLPQQQRSIPERWGPFEYYSIQDEDLPMPRHARRRVSTGEEEVLLDCNELEGRHVRGRVGVMKISSCQNLMAYTVDDGASEQYSCWVKDLRTGQTLEDDVIPQVVGIEWSSDGQSILYTHPDPADGRPSRVFRHVLGTAVANDQLLLAEDDPAAYMDVGRTKDWAFNVININTKAYSEVHLVSPEDGKLRVILPRRPYHQYFVEHHQGRLVVLSNHGGPDYQLLSVAENAPERWSDISKWDVLLPRREGVVIEDLDMFSSHAVLYLRENGKPKARASSLVFDRRRGWCTCYPDLPNLTISIFFGQQVDVLPMVADHSIDRLPEPVSLPLPDWALHLQPGLNPDTQSSQLVVSVSSPAHPPHRLRFNLQHPEDEPQVQQVDYPATDRDMCNTPLGAHPEDAGEALRAYRIYAPSADGEVDIPITISHKSRVELDGTAPLLLEVYGAYGMALEVDFCSHKLSLLDRGWVVASAHCRGGGELGQAWHEAGRRQNKQKGLEDAESVLDVLVARGYSYPGLAVVHGFSAGGLLAANLLLRKPEMLAGAWLQAPFVDLLTTATDPGLPMTVHEHDEWGDPAHSQTLQTIVSLCPYYNIPQWVPASVTVPAVLVTSALDDGRVPYWGPAKWVARYRKESEASEGQGGGPVVLCCEGSGGHYGFEPDEVKTTARAYAFLIAAVDRARPS